MTTATLPTHSHDKLERVGRATVDTKTGRIEIKEDSKKGASSLVALCPRQTFSLPLALLASPREYR